jgi:hypothetical protein
MDIPPELIALISVPVLLAPPQIPVISTEGGAFAAAVESPLYFVVALLRELR